MDTRQEGARSSENARSWNCVTLEERRTTAMHIRPITPTHNAQVEFAKY
jgi:hypothetical protein